MKKVWNRALWPVGYGFATRPNQPRVLIHVNEEGQVRGLGEMPCNVTDLPSEWIYSDHCKDDVLSSEDYRAIIENLITTLSVMRVTVAAIRDSKQLTEDRRCNALNQVVGMPHPQTVLLQELRFNVCDDDWQKALKQELMERMK